MTDNPRVGFISLGCPKALVDSERILTQLKCDGYEISDNYDNANVVVVNTCGFIDSAKAESLAAIGEALKENGKVIVTGCMGHNPEEITEQHPQVLAVTGPQQYEQVVNAVRDVVAPPAHDPYLDVVPPQGIKLTPRHYAYLKIAEGCNHKCTFCIIPDLRGKLVSRPLGEVMAEAEGLVRSGTRELLVVSQDTSAYGVDSKYSLGFWGGRPVKTDFYSLVKHLGELEAWIRLHYIYPYPHVDKILPIMAEGHVLPYLDIPFQHASPTVLKAMRRPAHAEKVIQRIHNWREVCPDLTIRSTFIVGFPGETEQDFDILLDFLRETQLDRVGCFQYSPVEGAQSNALDGQVPEDIMQDRWDRLMAVQQEISAAKLQKKVGQTMTVLVDDIDDARVTARSAADAPEIDGKVYISTGEEILPGEFLEVTITGADEYDLYAEF
ncbi:MAG: 30S ribosomal protein S12 methylthiotransferase RimO [bacterium]